MGGRSAEDDTTTETYTVTVTRAAADTPPTCTLNPGDIWCGVVTVAEFTLHATSGTLRGYFAEAGGSLTDDEFTHDGTPYRVSAVHYVSEAVPLSFTAGTLVLGADQTIPNGLTFHLGGAEFSTTSAVVSRERLVWSNSGLSWSVGDMVTLRLREASTPSTDATLSGLAVNDGSTDLTLDPAFAPGTTSYTAAVGNSVDEVTVTPTTCRRTATRWRWRWATPSSRCR